MHVQWSVTVRRFERPRWHISKLSGPAGPARAALAASLAAKLFSCITKRFASETIGSDVSDARSIWGVLSSGFGGVRMDLLRVWFESGASCHAML